ncbi:hypothetical protein BAE44_0010545 [Dichanthelium oligosanthes]|uniref:Chromatin target of PRMT1 protein C-terminal domain-containing protein n=1 Tax=Dichanthelium oligosanthes TaxID=888268 RepID=A0A1E5VTM6_9POAL|nr:hypothetical protein BAE44_0010545 [Dichanthelium oligosanthes]
MADALDMSLDDLISKNKNPRGRGPTSGGPAPAPPRRRFDTRAAAAPYHHRRGRGFFQAQAHAGYAQRPIRAAIDTPTRLYISNLDYAVSNDDIKGTAEVVFSTRSDALAALKRYNNVQLDGKTMKIEIIGTNLDVPRPLASTFVFNPPPGNFRVPFKGGPERGGAGGWPRGRGGFGGRGRGFGGRGRGRGGRGSEQVSAKDLDADLDKYHAAAMETS